MTTEITPARLLSEPPFQPVPAVRYNIPVGYLRAFVTILVLAFHSVLAYDTDAPQPPHSLLAQPRLWMAFPVVDPHRWSGFSLFIGFNDIFFMSLMFFLSGLFVWNGLRLKGSQRFLRDRALRLGVPFLIAAAMLAPLAYYPAYLQTSEPHSVISYFHQWLSLGEWPAGPAWFVWVLLAFDFVAAALFFAAPNVGSLLTRLSSNTERRPARFMGLLLAFSAMTYIPMALAFNPLRWTNFGPFYFQTSRILHYAVYFFAGISIGAFGLDRGLLAPTGELARRWIRWIFMALGMFVVAIVTAILAFANYSHAPRMWIFISGCGFVLSCAASCFAFLALFVRFARTPRKIYDAFRENAYGMYLIHYVFVSWVQYTLLRLMLPGLMKGTLAVLAVLALSLMTTAALRRVRLIAKVI
ncbi:MAG: acyltransferase [Acidobacteriaceae bacterium]|nr:acyltransferase [Acidobacteriaceae bacterium]MBV9781905.1 acyltransferase [Acidobacteriaceae bacterium]